MRNHVHQEIFFFTCLLMAFFLPVFPRLIPVIIIVMAANWLISGTYLAAVTKLLHEKWRFRTLSFASLYLLYLAGMFYSTDYTYGWYDLEVKLSLLIFPVIFATTGRDIFDRYRLRLFFGAYLAGCITGSLILLGHTWLVNDRNGVPDAFYYTNLSWYFHASYLAMYYTFASGVALYYMAGDFTKKSAGKIILLSAVCAYLEAMIFLLSSKAGLMMLLVTQGMFILLLISRKTRLSRVLLVATCMIFAFYSFSRMLPFAFKRVSSADTMITTSRTVVTNPNDGTVARMEIWKVSAGLISQHFLFGVGTGDVKNVLMDAYREKKLYPIVKKKLNAHNQYLQTFIALGVFGFSLLLATLVIPAYRSLRRGNYLYVVFLVIFAGNILFESMLETQAGVVFYALFNVLLYTSNRTDPADDPVDVAVR